MLAIFAFSESFQEYLNDGRNGTLFAMKRTKYSQENLSDFLLTKTNVLVKVYA